MGRFQGLAAVRTNQGSIYFLAGDYVVDLQEIKFITNRKRTECFIIAGKIVESTNPDRAPGTVASQVITIREDILATVMGNIKQFAGAVLGIQDPDGYLAEIDPTIQIPEIVGGVATGRLLPDTPQDATDRFWDESLEAMVHDSQPCKGIRIRLNCTTIKTKEGKDFTKHIWGPTIDVPPVPTPAVPPPPPLTADNSPF
jgi:hypothetical protein